MKIIEIKDQDRWNKFVAENGSQFLESADWADFQENLGRRVWRLALVHDSRENEILAVALVIKYFLPLDQNYLYSPRGPIVETKNYFNLLINKIKEIAQKENSIFIRLEPTSEKQKVLLESLRETGFRESKPIQPKDEWRLNLAPSEEEILRALHPKTRYNIGLAKKYGIKIRLGQGEADFREFWRMISETYERKELKTHPQDYYYQMSKLKSVRFFLAEYQGRVLAANLLAFFGQTVYYLHGGSGQDQKRVMAPYWLFWQNIFEAKRAGYNYFNFGGIAPASSASPHPWLGLTRFKKGFGGQEVNYLGTWDLPIKRTWFWLYRLTKKLFSR